MADSLPVHHSTQTGNSALRYALCESQFHIRSHPVYPVYPCSILSPSLPLRTFPVTP